MRGVDRTFAMLMAVILGMVPLSTSAVELTFETVLERVSRCGLDLAAYRGLWARDDALLINLPAGGALKGILVSQFYMAPGRNGSEGDYGVVLNAPLAQVAITLPDLAGKSTLNGRQRQLVALIDETGNPRHRGQALLVCRGGAGI